jgi:hypothetical protein
VSATWDTVADGLTETFAALPDQSRIVITGRNASDHRVLLQFAHLGVRIDAETVITEDRTDLTKLSEPRRQGLLALGWQPPEDPTHNWRVRLPWPASSAGYRRLADMSVGALRDVYGVAGPADVTADAWVDGTEEPLELPHLGLRRVGQGVTLPVARTNLEAHLYMDLHPCPRCRTAEFERANEVIEEPEGLASRYRGLCETCGRPRVFTFRLPEVILPPTPGQPRYGDDEPSQLIDPGEWILVADWYARSEVLGRAAAAVDEVLKFVPPGADEVPESAFWTERGRRAYLEEPGRFRVRRLVAVRGTYRGLADR